MKLINATQMMFEESEAYISAQAQITDKVTRDINYVVHWKLQQLLDDAPAVDAVPMVRCKDCVWYSIKKGCPIAESGMSKQGVLLPLQNDFCSYGERKADE